jgi:hypothetical protein
VKDRRRSLELLRFPGKNFPPQRIYIQMSGRQINQMSGSLSN